MIVGYRVAADRTTGQFSLLCGSSVVSYGMQVIAVGNKHTLPFFLSVIFEFVPKVGTITETKARQVKRMPRSDLLYPV